MRSWITSSLAVLVLSIPTWATTILPEDDANWRTNTRYNNFTNGTTTFFGLFTKGNGTADRAYVEFIAGTTPATSATLKLYNFWGTPQNKTVNFDVRIRAIGESEPGYIQWTETAGPAPSGTAHESWTQIGDFHVDSTPAWYPLDVTAVYNANLGQRITFSIRALSGTGDGPIFEDKESTGGTGNAPHIEWVPEPASALLLAAGALLLRRSRRR